MKISKLANSSIFDNSFNEAQQIKRLRLKAWHKILINPNDLADILRKAENLWSIKTSDFNFRDRVVQIGAAGELDSQLKTQLEIFLKAFMPWKKGPYNIFGFEINAEWDSSLKWARLLDSGLNLKDKRIVDIGSHNGYFLFRMHAENPEFVIGIEPVIKHWLSFEVMSSWLGAHAGNLFYEPIGVEHFEVLSKKINMVFCLGILYHHTDPVGLLRKLHQSTTHGTELIIDCQTIAGQEPIALFPETKYAGSRGFYFIPTLETLLAWVKRSGFIKTEIIYDEELLFNEQCAKSAWANCQSLNEGINAETGLTIEGYPAPRRVYLKTIRG